MEQPPFVMRGTFMQRRPVLLLKKKADEERRFFLESRKKQRTCVMVMKVYWIKLNDRELASRTRGSEKLESLGLV